MLTDCDDQSYYVIKWMACLFDICKKKDTSSLRHALVQAQQEKKQQTKKTKGKKEKSDQLLHYAQMGYLLTMIIFYWFLLETSLS